MTWFSEQIDTGRVHSTGLAKLLLKLRRDPELRELKARRRSSEESRQPLRLDKELLQCLKELAQASRQQDEAEVELALAESELHYGGGQTNADPLRQTGGNRPRRAWQSGSSASEARRKGHRCPVVSIPRNVGAQVVYGGSAFSNKIAYTNDRLPPSYIAAVLRTLKRTGRVLPVDHQAERRQHAQAQKPQS